MSTVVLLLTIDNSIFFVMEINYVDNRYVD